MVYSVSTSEFRKMSKEQRAEAVSQLARGAFEENGRAEQLEAQIDEFERKYGFDSASLLKQLSDGRLNETDEISEWLWLLNFSERV